MTTQQTKLPAQRWFRNRRSWLIAAGVSMLLLLILISLPYGIQFGLADFLEKHGAREVLIRNIDFNPFSGRLLFEGVTAVSDNAQKVRLERLELVLGWRDLFAKHARIEAVELQGLEAVVDLSDPAKLGVSGLSFSLAAGYTEPSEEAVSNKRPWGFALDQVDLRGCRLELRRDDLVVDLELEQLGLQRVISWQLQEQADLSLKARLNGAPLVAGLRASLFDATREIEGQLDLQGFDLSSLQPLLSAQDGLEVAGRLTLQQTFRLQFTPANQVSWESKGLLQGEALRPLAAQFEGGDLSILWQGKSGGDWSARRGLRLQLDGRLEGALPLLRLPAQVSELSLAGYRWEGRLDLTQDEAGLALQADGAVALDGLSLQRHQLLADLSSLGWRGAFSLMPEEATSALSAKGEGHLEGLRLSEREGSVPLAELRRLDLSGASISPGNRLAAAGLSLQGIRLDQASGDKEDPLLLSEALSLKEIGFAQPAGLSIGLVEQQGLRAQLSRDRAGQLNLMGFVERLRHATMPESNKDESKTQAAPAEPMAIKIDRLVWQGKNRANFTDHSVQPPFRLSLEVKRLSLSDIDSSQPGKPSPFLFEGGTGRHAEMSAEGEITLFQSDPSGRLEGRLKGVEMVPLSSYTIPAIGYHLDSGELDAEIDLALQKGMLKGNNHLIIRRLDVTRANEAEAAKLEDRIAMPLDSALGMLQDKNQTIDLNLPVSGKLSDPNVALGDVINTALGNALKKGAMTYITTALFPYGTMVALLKMAGEEAAAVRLDPVGFAAGAALLDDQDRDYLGKVAQVLKERPKIAVKLCGAAVQADREELARRMAAQAKAKKPEQEGEAKAEEAALPAVSEEELLALATQRAEAIEDYLVTQQGVSASRAVVCRPVIDPQSGAAPRVDLQI